MYPSIWTQCHPFEKVDYCVSLANEVYGLETCYGESNTNHELRTKYKNRLSFKQQSMETI